MKNLRRLVVTAVLVTVGFLALPAGMAAAHPLGNFSVNRYAALTVHPDRIDALAVADLAELPTLQESAPSCDEAAGALSVSTDGKRLRWKIQNSSLTYAAGAGGLRTSRLECRLTASADISGPVRVEVANGFRDDRIGWRELVAAGSSGVRLSESSLPSVSSSNELRSYPSDPLSSPADVRSATFTAAPGDGGAAAGPVAAGSDQRSSGLLAGAERRLEDLVGGERFTPLVGLLAVLLSLVLGAAHAALPGHGKTVMAAYLAGSRGRPRDAVLVGATVTFTHTAGVIALGLLLTAASGVAGESVLGWLGLASGTLVTAVGAGALISAIRKLRALRRQAHSHEAHSHEAGEAHGHTHSHGHEHGHAHGHGHGHAHTHDHGPGKWGIAGLGVAGGLVPSPSALIVLLGAAALGRTVFGVLLVIAYGLGMAATLTAAGLLLVKVRHRFEGRWRLARRWSVASPAATAALIMAVGLGLAGRALAGIA